ncbi:F0F1 ATP synthase subunit epsilon [Actibacterium lipolyticum]|uniref:ATP synthase epsilon chain n=1 Tax=Actibacterium lipolyticum TaxID=1524263 RepID=A0A238JN73_9RHOB|nr:F0F1 ATP synthase subunit epsilon [Actibacterium lipolyticum]SMX31647.1 ATP synthase epsilon chain [Actibacterium lipolyticum]
MADTMQFDLVSPERRLSSVQATEVRIPGADGDLTAMPNHAPVITTLRPGVLEVITAEGSTTYVVTGGFAEVSSTGTTVLAEQAHAVSDVTQEMIDAMVAEAHEAHKAAHPDVVDAAAKLLSDLVAMGGHIGLEPTLPTS